MKFRGWLLVVGLCVMSCGGNDPAPPGSAGASKGSGGSGNQTGSGVSCSETKPVGWDEQTSLGVSPAQAFASLAGECTAALSWDATSSDNLIVSPESGSSDVTVTVTLDQGSARVVLPVSCGRWENPPSMQVDAHVHLESKDGSFVFDADVPAQYGGGALAALSFSVSSADLGGNLSIQPKDPGTSVQLSFTVDPLGNDCVGTVNLDTAMSMPGGGFGASGVFGSWSDTGCSVGQKSVALDTPGQDGTPSLSAVIQTAWRKTYSGTWDDGTTTELTIELGALPAKACTDASAGGGVTLPVQVTYDTADGRVRSHTVPVDLTFDNGGAQPRLALNTNEDFACDAATATLPYTPADCSALSHIVMQLSLAINTGGANGGDLTVYDYAKNPDPSGAADVVQKLSLSVP
jgi:hypothetical protein